MAQDVIQIVERYLSDDPTKWAKLSSEIEYRRLQLALLREIVVELRRLNAGEPPPESRMTDG